MISYSHTIHGTNIEQWRTGKLLVHSSMIMIALKITGQQYHYFHQMSFRILKNYKLNYHILPDSSELVPGNQISMSSYAGT